MHCLAAPLEYKPQEGSGFGQPLRHARSDTTLFHAPPLPGGPGESLASLPASILVVLQPASILS